MIATAIELAAAIRIAAAERRRPLRSGLRCDTPLRYDRSGGACFYYCFSMFSFAGVKLWLNCQPGVLSWDLGHCFFGCCLVNSCGGLFR